MLKRLLIMIFIIILPSSAAVAGRYDKLPTLSIAICNNLHPFSFLNADNKPAGIFVDTWNLWSLKTGRTIKFIPSECSETISNLEKGKVDVHSGMIFQQDRFSWLSSATPFYEVRLSLFYLNKDKHVSRIEQLQGMTIAVLRGSFEEFHISRDHKYLKPLFCNSVEELVKTVKSGKAFGFICQQPVGQSAILRMGFSSEFISIDNIHPKFRIHPAVRSEDGKLIEFINEGFSKITMNELVEIEARWIADPENRHLKSTKLVTLSKSEDEWRNKHKPIRVGISPVFPPLKFREDGVIKGIEPDYLELLSQYTGIMFDYVISDLASMDEKVKSGEIDMFISFNIPSRLEYMTFTSPIFEFKQVVVARNNSPFISDISNLKGKRVAIVEGVKLQEKLLADHPDIVAVRVKTMEEMFQAVSSGQADALFSKTYYAGHVLHQYPTLKMAGVLDLPPEPYLYAVRKDYPQLVSILNKAIASIPKTTVDATIHKWVNVKVEYKPNWRATYSRLLGIGCGISIIVGTVLYWNRRLSIEVRQRKQAQEIIQYDEKRLEALLRISRQNFNSIPELLQFSLREALLLTNSRQGCFYEYSEETGEVRLLAGYGFGFPDETPGKPDRYNPCDNIDFIKDSLRLRQHLIVTARPDQGSCSPIAEDGAALLNNTIYQPVMFRDRPVAVACISYRETEYTDTDAKQLSILMDDVWKMAEQERTKYELNASENNFRSMLETVQLLAIILDTEGNIRFCNDFLLQLSGWARDEVLGRNWFDLFIAENEKEKVLKIFASLVSKNSIFNHFENHILTRSGNKRLIAWSNTAVYDSAGKLDSVASIGNDITDYKRAEEQLRQSMKMESVGRLAGGVAHDFNNKLSVILGYSELLKMRLANNQDAMDKLKAITTAAEHSRDITAQLLTFSRQQLITPKTINPNETIMATAKTLPRLIGEDVRISYRLGDNIQSINIDPVQFDQIIINLALNARDAMPNGGELIIETGTEAVDSDFCFDHPDARQGNYLKLSIIDTGYGMDSETLKHIFEPFYTTKEVGKGTGLGLATIYGIVTQNKGFITVHSTIGAGTRFEIYLPLVTENAMQSNVQTAVNVNKGTGTVLLVEDDESVCEMTASMLGELGYNVIKCNSPDKGITVSENNSLNIDLVLADIILPTMDGRTMVDRIREKRPNIKALFMSGYSADHISEKGIIDNNINFIQKPFNISRLSDKLRQICEGS